MLALAGVVIWVVWPAGGALRSGSEEIDPGPVEIGARTPSSYRIVYRVEARAGEEVSVSTDVLEVRRPFDARTTALQGPPPGDREVSVRVSTLGRLASGTQAVFAITPGPPASDRRPAAVLSEAVDAGYAEERERRMVAGRACRVVRIGGDPGVRGLRPVAESPRDYTDVCIDEAGLALEEALFLEEELILRRVAVEVDEDPGLSDELFEVGDVSLDFRQGGGSVQRVSPTSRTPGTFWELSDAPEGFEHRGRYAVIPPQEGFGDPLRRGSIVALVADVWVAGIDVLVVEQGGTIERRDPFAADPNAQTVDLGDLGEGELRYGLASSELRVLRDGGRFLRVWGTVAPSRLAGVMRDLTEVEGGDLVVLDEVPSDG